MTLTGKLWIGIGALIVLSPLGLILPDQFKAGSAWGEWGGGRDSKNDRVYSPGVSETFRTMESTVA